MPQPTPAPPLADAAAATPSLRTLGTTGVQAAAGNDSRIVSPAGQFLTAFAAKNGVAASVAYNTYDLVTPWGAVQNWTGWGVSGGATDPINVLNAYPMVFPVACTIKDILIKNNVGATATKYKLAIYANLGTGYVYPGARLFNNAEINPLPTGITTISVNLAVAAGTVLWLVHTCDNTAANINLSTVAAASLCGPVLMGVGGTLLTEPFIGWQQAQTYDGTLPNPYPITAPTALSSSGHGPPAFFIRFGP